jgi:uncharacterized membrane protein YhdT
MIYNLMIIYAMIFSSVLTLIAAGITLVQRYQQNNSKLMYLFANWLCWGIAWLIIAFGRSNNNPDIMGIGYIFQVIGTVSFLIFIENSSNVYMNPIRISFLSIICYLYISNTFDPTMNEVIPDYGVHVIGTLRIYQILFGVSNFYLNFIWIYKIWKAAPEELRKKSTNTLLLGGIIGNIIPVLLYIIATKFILLGIIPFFIHAIGLVIIVFVLRKDPRLINVLPFMAHRIVVIHRKSGLLLYEHAWSSKKFNDNILSGLFYALEKISTLELLSGELDQMIFQQGFVNFKHGESCTVALISNKYSTYLETCLSEFSAAFEKTILELNLADQEFVVKEDYEFAKALIQKYFVNIPSHIN